MPAGVRSRDVSGLPPIPTGGPGVPPLLAAAGVGYGEGFAGNSHRHAPGGMLAAVTYLVEELGANVNARDHEGSTAVHHAAVARRHRDDSLSRQQRRRREGRQPRGSDDGRHGERPGAARATLAGDDQIPREPRRQEQPPLSVVLTTSSPGCGFANPSAAGADACVTVRGECP